MLLDVTRGMTPSSYGTYDIAARARCEQWDSLEISRPEDEDNNQIKNFNAVWMGIQKFPLSKARLVSLLW